jgi:lysophospholipase L1-like esterase
MTLDSIIIILVCLFFCLILFCEIIFRGCFRFVKKERYLPFIFNRKSFKKAFEEFPYCPHPHLVFKYKKSHYIASQPFKERGYNFEGKYTGYGVFTNGDGFLNGPDGDRPVIMPKPKNSLRICCLGASTTGEYVKEGDRVLSYPSALENQISTVASVKGKEAEVINCGMGGWDSIDIMVNFMLNVCDYQPDAIIIYHANNDIPYSAIEGFRPDYDHAKRSIDEVYTNLENMARFPYIPSYLYYYFLNLFFKKALSDSQNTGSVKYKKKAHWEKCKFQSLQTYQRNLENIIAICKSRNIQVVLSTYIHMREFNEVHGTVAKKTQEGIRLENDVMRMLADKHKLLLVDNAKTFPREEKYFTDTIHFSHLGMKKLAESLVEPICQAVGNNS